MDRTSSRLQLTIQVGLSVASLPRRASHWRWNGSSLLRFLHPMPDSLTYPISAGLVHRCWTLPRYHLRILRILLSAQKSWPPALKTHPDFLPQRSAGETSQGSRAHSSRRPRSILPSVNFEFALRPEKLSDHWRTRILVIHFHAIRVLGLGYYVSVAFTE
jgi:hypothetical protein